jgi:hypothetical protein
MRLPGFTAEASVQNHLASLRSAPLERDISGSLVTMAACPPGTQSTCETTCSCVPVTRKCPNPIARSCGELNCPPERPCCPWCPSCMSPAECSMYA